MSDLDRKAFFEDFENKLKELSVGCGDILYVASDVTSILYTAKEKLAVRGMEGKRDFLRELTEVCKRVVGPEGTLLFPVFSWSFCRGEGFDIRKTKGEVGAWANFVMENCPEFVRTAHPMYSFMVYGKYACELQNMQNQDGWGAASPFPWMREHGAKQLFFGIEAHQGYTFCHFVEQCLGVPYRHPKYFFGPYTDARGITEIRCYSMNVRDLEVSEHCTVTNAFLISSGVATGTEWENITLTVVDLPASYEVLVKDMKENNGANSLGFANYALDWSKPVTLAYEMGKIPE